MKFPQSLVPGVLQRRYKRFLADVALETGATHVVHVPNPGAMLGLVPAGVRVWLSAATAPKRKLAYTLELVEAPHSLVGVNTLHANRLVGEALSAGELGALGSDVSVAREVSYGTNSRADFRLTDGVGRTTWVEVKSVTLSRVAGLAEWPDCVSARGAKHVVELARRVLEGDRAVLVFVVQRSDCDRLAISADLDPSFADALEAARAAGVEVQIYDCDVGIDAVAIRRPLPSPFRSDPGP